MESDNMASALVIEEEDFRLTGVAESSHFWDLELLHTVKPKGKESRKEFKIAGYGMPLPSALKKVINFRIASKHPDAAITLKQYLDEYKEEVKKLEHLCGESGG